MNKNHLQRKKMRTSVNTAGTTEVPRLAVYRSSKHIYAQLIDDTHGTTLAAITDAKITEAKNKTERAYSAGQQLADKAKSLKIKRIRFDRGGFKYHGRVKALADGARANGLEF